VGGLHSRNKGKRFEREVANAFKRVFGETVRRGWQSRGGQDDPDVIMPGLWVECKHYGRKVDLQAAHRQAKMDLSAALSTGREAVRKLPAVAHKTDRTIPMVTMSMDDFITLLLTLKARDCDVLCNGKFANGLDSGQSGLSACIAGRAGVHDEGEEE
jgi:hypothetical protein